MIKNKADTLQWKQQDSSDITNLQVKFAVPVKKDI